MAEDAGAPDVVAASVASYSEDPEAFETYGADAVAGPFASFAAALGAGATVLDAGCGPGRDLARLAALGHRPLGIDGNPDFVLAARRHGPVVLGDLRSLPLGGGCVDAVWACASLAHLPPPAAAVAVGELARVARPDALLDVSVRTGGRTGWADDPTGLRAQVS